MAALNDLGKDSLGTADCLVTVVILVFQLFPALADGVNRANMSYSLACNPWWLS